MARLGPIGIMRGLRRAAFIAALAGAAGCGARSVAALDSGIAPAVTDATTPATTDAGVIVTDTPVTPITPDAMADATVQQPMVSPVDQDIAAVLQSINTGEIRAAEVALTRAMTPSVREFAARMASEHRAQNEQLEMLLTRLGTAASANQISAQIDAAATADVQQLGTFMGVQFDRAYLAQQSFVHRQALGLIDAALIPQSQNRELRAFIDQMRTAIEMHLREAERLQTTLGPA